MSNIFEYTPNIDFEKHVFWQYNNSPSINSLVSQKQEWYIENHQIFWQNWITNVLTLSTANDYGLAVWGNLLKTPRTWKINGESVTLTTQQYRTLLIARLRLLSIRGTVEEINGILNFLFKNYGKAWVIDNYDMTITYRFNFTLTDLQLEILRNLTLLPRPAGVEMQVIAVGNNVFGFNGSGCQPFNQAPFAVYSNIL